VLSVTNPLKGSSMNFPYDILKKYDDGSLRWVEAVADLKCAQDRIEELAQRSPGEYWIFDQDHQTMIGTTRSKAAGSST
jgi:hypothetical protein